MATTRCDMSNCDGLREDCFNTRTCDSICRSRRLAALSLRVYNPTFPGSPPHKSATWVSRSTLRQMREKGPAVSSASSRAVWASDFSTCVAAMRHRPGRRPDEPHKKLPLAHGRWLDIDLKHTEVVNVCQTHRVRWRSARRHHDAVQRTKDGPKNSDRQQDQYSMSTTWVDSGTGASSIRPASGS